MRVLWLPVAILAACVLTGAAPSVPRAFSLLGRGVQVYACAVGPAAAAWVLQGPDADLFDDAGIRVGRHFAGPTWRAEDGSLVRGKAVATSAAPRPGSVPWLVLKATSHAGAGLMAPVAYVTRSDTQGGAAPAGGCDADHRGALARVAYSARYTFFPEP